MAFLDDVRSGQKTKSDEAKSISNFNNAVTEYAKGYSKWAKENDGKYKGSSASEVESRLRDLVKQAGMRDGAFGEDATEAQIAAYGNEFLPQIQEEQNFGFTDYIRKYGTAEQQKAYNKVEENAAKALSRGKDPIRHAWRDANQIWSMSWPIAREVTIANEIGTNIEQNAAKRTLEKATSDYNNWLKEANRTGYDLFENYENYVSDTPTTTTETSTSTPAPTSTDTGDVVTFQLDRANDPNYRGFGQKIVDLGLATNNGLWGSNGDVAFYTQQLYDQGALDANGNLKIGVPIKLRRRR